MHEESHREKLRPSFPYHFYPFILQKGESYVIESSGQHWLERMQADEYDERNSTCQLIQEVIIKNKGKGRGQKKKECYRNWQLLKSETDWWKCFIFISSNITFTHSTFLRFLILFTWENSFTDSVELQLFLLSFGWWGMEQMKILEISFWFVQIIKY